jgi:hypothetical protein
MPTLSEMVQDPERFLSDDILPRLPLSASIRLCHETMVARKVSGVVIEDDGVPLYLLSLTFLRRFIEAVRQKGVPPIGPHPAWPATANAFEIAALLPIWSYLYLNLVDPGYLEGVEPDGDPGVLKVIGLPFQDDPEKEFDLGIEGQHVLQVEQSPRGWYFTGDVDRFNANAVRTDPPSEYRCVKNGHTNKSWDRGICSNCPSRLA